MTNITRERYFQSGTERHEGFAQELYDATCSGLVSTRTSMADRASSRHGARAATS